MKWKNTVNFEHKHDLVYHGKCPDNNCNDVYVGETGRRILERILDHNGRDVKSHLLKQLIKKASVSLKIDFVTISVVFRIIQ